MQNIIAAIICKAWQSKNPALLVDVLAENFIWNESSFDEPVTDKEELLKMWEKDLSGQSKIKVICEDIVAGDSITVVRWVASFERFGKSVDMDGIYIITFNKQGKLTEFNQWYTTKAT